MAISYKCWIKGQRSSSPPRWDWRSELSLLISIKLKWSPRKEENHQYSLLAELTQHSWLSLPLPDQRFVLAPTLSQNKVLTATKEACYFTKLPAVDLGDAKQEKAALETRSLSNFIWISIDDDQLWTWNKVQVFMLALEDNYSENTIPSQLYTQIHLLHQRWLSILETTVL